MPKPDPTETLWRGISAAFRKLNPELVAQDADRPISLALVAEEARRLRRMEAFFVPGLLTARKRAQVRERLCSFIFPVSRLELEGLQQLDLVICSEGAAGGMAAFVPRAYVFSPESPHSVVKAVLSEHWDLALPLAKNFLPFRRAVDRRLMISISVENGLFAVMAGLPDVLPAPFSMARPDGGLGSSTALLTANQMRLAFLLAAANDSEVGFREQTGQMTAIAAAALAWRFLAREWEGRISPVQGLLAKGLLALGATVATGLALEQLHRWGRSMTREEKAVAYEEAYRVGRSVLDGILDAWASRSRSEA